MASNRFIRLCLVLLLLFGLMNRVLMFPTLDLTSQEYFDLSSIDDDTISNNDGPFQDSNNVELDSLSRIQLPEDRIRRNVILPRMCYYARVLKRGIYKKLCLPYNQSSS